MILYLDSSALVKLVIDETESEALRRHLALHANDLLMTSVIARTEVVRAVRVVASEPRAADAAREVLDALHLLPVHVDLLDRAADLPGSIRSLDAIHLASAMYVSPQLRAVVTYDRRMAVAAGELGLAVATPT